MKTNEITKRNLIECMLSDKDLYLRISSKLSASAWAGEGNEHEHIGRQIQFIKDYFDEYGVLPERDQIKAKLNAEIVGNPSFKPEGHNDWFVDECDNISQRHALNEALAECSDMANNRNFNGLKEVMAKVETSKVPRLDHGINFAENADEYMRNHLDSGPMTPTGYADIDRILRGGLREGELNLFMAQTGGGKSWWLCNMAYNFLERAEPKNVLFVTMEMPMIQILYRFVMMYSGNDDFWCENNPGEAILKIKGLMKRINDTGGKLVIEFLPSLHACTADIGALIQGYKDQKGIEFDAVCVDYLDCLVPNSGKEYEAFEREKHTSVELRNLAIDSNVIMLTASQINREGDNVKPGELFQRKHIGGGISKLQNASNAFVCVPILEEGMTMEYNFQFLKTRSAGAIGRVIQIPCNPDKMRIADNPDYDGWQSPHPRPKPKPAETEDVPSPVRKSSIREASAPEAPDADETESEETVPSQKPVLDTATARQQRDNDAGADDDADDGNSEIETETDTDDGHPEESDNNDDPSDSDGDSGGGETKSSAAMILEKLGASDVK